MRLAVTPAYPDNLSTHPGKIMNMIPIKHSIVALSLLYALPLWSVELQDIEADYPYLEKLYHHLHRNPELSFHEEKTAKRLSKELNAVGFKVTEGVGGHGIVGVIENGKGPTVLIRADMDGLPIEEKTGLPYASRTQVTDDLGNTVNTMHACGHDVHMTVFAGVARRLAAARSEWSGTLVMIGQPAEERGAGARAMISDGLFERFPRPDYALGLHVKAAFPAGQVGYIAGYAMANVDSVDIRIHGIGGHGAYPHTTKDPVVLAAAIINSLQTLVSREISPLESAVVTVGSIHGGTKHNIIPDYVDLQLTVRSYSDSTREKLLSGIKRIARTQALVTGLPRDKLPVVSIRDEYTPALYNNPQLTQRLVPVLTQQLGAERLVEVSPVMGGEDFSQYGRVEPKIPSFFFWLGAIDPKIVKAAQKSGENLPSLHSAHLAPLPRPTIVTGVEAMTAAALDLFSN